MNKKIEKLFSEIELRKKALLKEYELFRKKYDFEFIKWKIRFWEKARVYNRSLRIPAWKSIFTPNVRHTLSIPFIYMMVIPTFIFDIFLFIYQQTAFRLYKIPMVRRRNYIVYDRHLLDYLNWFQKFNCLYCSYVNGFLWYAVEVAGRTEAYWCPIKHAKKHNSFHSLQKEFADYWDADWFIKKFKNESCFKK